jgi:RNA polymerase sigma-70 factor (ECF subfamily)
VMDASPDYFPELYRKSGAARFALAYDDFAAILAGIGARYSSTAEAFYRSLRLEDLALAHACARSSETAWILFIERYRPKLFQMALAIAREESAARELADSLYADLFGTRQRSGGARVSKLESYTGRGSLEGWLKAILAQEYVNRFRTGRNLVSFDEQVDSGVQFPSPETTHEIQDPRLESATDAAISALPEEDGLILSCYYLDERTLAEIGRMLGVHESTVSRRLEKITSRVRKEILKGLRRRGVSAREAEELLHTDVRTLNVEVERKKPVPDPFFSKGRLR